MLSALCQENHLLPAHLEHATAGHPLRKSRPNTRNLILIAIFLQVFNKKRPFRITELDSLQTVMLQEAAEFLPPAQVPRTHTQSFELLPLFPKYPTLSSEASMVNSNSLKLSTSLFLDHFKKFVAGNYFCLS